jgi:DNA (cytosine-5)-methyltransferase 1
MKRDHFTRPLDFPGELIIDNFAGGGGTSEGLEQAFGRHVDIAINHDPEALAMHAINHPRTLHLCESVWTVNPIKVTRNQPVGLVWLSPDCKHFSKAKGGTPVSKDIRGLAWVGMRWAALTKPRVMMLENVEEFQTWGPLKRVELQEQDQCGNPSTRTCWQPDPAKKGRTFDSFVRQLRAHGYNVDWRELRACDQGAPTIRKRLFLVARRDGLPIVWPEAEYALPTSRAVLAGKLLPFRTAAECIDFDLPSRSIFDRKKDLAQNTQRRVAMGLWRHVLTSPKPFIVGVGGRMGQSPARGVNQPVQTITSKADSCIAQPVLAPIITGAGGPAYSGKPVPADQPFGALTTENHRAVAVAALAPFLGDQSRPAEGKTAAADEPMRTQCAQVKGGHFTVIAPTLAPLRGTSAGHMGGHEIEQPLSTVSAGGTHHALVGANLITIGYGERTGQPARAQDVKKPLGTVVAANKHAVAGAFMTKFRANSIGHPLDEPMHTITANSFVKRPGGSLPMGVVSAFLEQANGGFYEGDGRAADAPLSTIAARGANQRLVTAYCVKYYSSGGQWQGLAEPMHTLPTKARMGLVQTIQVAADCLAPEHRARARQCAQLLHRYLPEHFPEPADLVLIGEWVLVDITLRMLRSRELFRAQGFPEHYIIEEIPDPAILFKDGVQSGDPLAVPRIPLTATAQVRMCGNSVSPPQARALALANFSHERLIYGREAA